MNNRHDYTNWDTITLGIATYTTPPSPDPPDTVSLRLGVHPHRRYTRDLLVWRQRRGFHISRIPPPSHTSSRYILSLSHDTRISPFLILSVCVVSWTEWVVRDGYRTSCGALWASRHPENSFLNHDADIREPGKLIAPFLHMHSRKMW